MKSETSRRRFLKNSLATGAALSVPFMVPGSARGADGAVAPSNKITMGCIGVGSMGTGNMKVFLGLPDCQVVAVCDTYEDRRQSAKGLVDAQYGDTGCAMYGDYRELLAREDIDAVMIAVQDHWHVLVATAAAKAGKDMYCEKPLGVSVEQSRCVRDTVRAAKRVFQTGTWQRSVGKFQQACRLARNGFVGTIHTIEVATEGPNFRPSYTGTLEPQPVPEGFDWVTWQGPAPQKPYNPGRVAWPDWYLIFDYCTGFISNWGVHHLDIANWGCPRIGDLPFEIECSATYRNEGFTDNVDTWNATFTYPDGLTMVFTDSAQRKSGCRFIGDAGWVHVDRSGIWAEPETLLEVEFKDTHEALTDSTHHGDNLLQCIRSRKDPVSDVDAAHKASCLGMLADIAARVHKKLKWDPVAERFAGDDEANAMLKRSLENGWSV
ncbi:MAG TPA: Gfo/Idh/MocA family oxidoreductase [Candidatus Hydrogenedentes bacterium]|nr:Gfo/Idh/MocA family oxidoreductase [Candidatus Hydrogenedentota bacterium]HPG69998.1 Gfo/Idh/MocA family oxidoreductase [Candidatus Hydrogenedentota bacterium]